MHLKNQPYYSLKMNNAYSALYFLVMFIDIENLLFTLIKINGRTNIYLVYCGSGILFFAIGWFFNMFYYKQNVDRIINKIQKKYNQSNVIQKLKSDLEEEYDLRHSTKSLETIGKYLKYFNIIIIFFVFFFVCFLIKKNRNI